LFKIRNKSVGLAKSIFDSVTVAVRLFRISTSVLMWLGITRAYSGFVFSVFLYLLVPVQTYQIMFHEKREPFFTVDRFLLCLFPNKSTRCMVCWVLTTLLILFQISWVVTPLWFEINDILFGESYCLFLQSRKILR